MIIYFILTVILLLLLSVFFLMVSPIHILISYNHSLSIKVKLLFVSVKLFPLPDKLIKSIKKSTPTKKSHNKKSENSKNPSKESEGILTKIKFFKTMVSLMFSHCKNLVKRINFKINYLNLGITGADASDTAIKYEQCIIAIATFWPHFEHLLSFEKENINIYPNFAEYASPLELDLDISFRLICIIYEMLIFAKNYAKISNKKNLDNSEGCL